ncbi:DUF6089 family protein [Dawidia soli]|uniref:Outer membrane beta-barrel protein n=1 Tax=Dawidia soli TaxID=2782352 RepID=A0AAP2GJB5_9BACT|nr:DUF6089 family protein [Dawidia soli]MBT1688310.1 outer membrane beta-barrel protein [Dawidia soli]
MKRFFTISFIAILLPAVAEAQSFYAIRKNRNLLVGLGSGTANYYGELVNPGEMGKLKPNVAVSGEYYLTPRISTRATLTWFQTSGSDAKANDDRQERNLSFTSSNFELSAVGIINLMPIGTRFYQRPKLNPYGFIGIGLLYFNPKAEYQGKKYALAPLETEGSSYSRLAPVIPMGFGVRVKLDPFFNLLVEGGYRVTFTDHLDDISIRRYPDPATLKSDIARALSDRRVEIGTQPSRPTEIGVRGNPEKNDSYFIGSITLQYYLPQEVFNGSNRKLYNRKRKAYYKRR